MCRLTIEPLDHPAAAFTDASDTPARSARTPIIYAVREQMAPQGVCACGDSGTTRGLPVIDLRTNRKLSARFTSEICRRSI